MAIEQKTFSSIVNMNAADISDLIETVAQAATLNANLASNTSNKLIVAGKLIGCANELIEQCGCRINIVIEHPSWSSNITYTTK